MEKNENTTLNCRNKHEFLRFVGLKIARLRRSKKITQADFAEEIGIMINTISRVEGAKVDAKLSTLKSIADGLGQPISELLDIEEFHKSNFTNSNERIIEEIARLCRGFDEKTLMAIKAQIKALQYLKKQS